jgi:multiple sugar transport system permease protein
MTVERQLALLCTPAVLFTVVMIAFPVGYSVWLSFQAFSLGGGSTFNGGENYVRMVEDPEFWNGLKVTFVLYAISLIAQLVIGTYLAILLNASKRMVGFLRSALLSPFVMPPVVVGMMWIVILDPAIGVANYVLQSMGLPPSDWLASPRWVIATVALVDTWQWSPFVALIVLGGLQSLPGSVYEAAEVDGVSRWAVFRYVTLPLLAPTLLTAAILRSVDLLRFFDIIYITTGGGPGNASNTLNIYGFRVGFEFFEIGYACALMVTLSTIVLGAVLLITKGRNMIDW